MKNKLFEIGGIRTIGIRNPAPGISNPINTPNTNQIQYKPKNNNSHGLSLSARHCTSMMGWQARVFSQLMSGKSVYVVAKPGAGKTTPVMCFWAQKVLGLNPTMSPNNMDTLFRNIERLIMNPESIPKTLFLVPVRALAELTYREIIGDYADIILQGLRAYIDNRLGQFRDLLKTVLYNTNTNQSVKDNINRLMGIHRDLFNQLDFIKRNNNLYDHETKLKIDDIQSKIDNNLNILHESMGDLIKQFIEQKLISQVSGTHSADKGNIQSAPMIIAIYESGGLLLKNKTLNAANLKLVFADESHLTQYVYGNIDDRAVNISKSIYYILKTVSVDTQFVFMSGTVNPTAAKDFGKYIQTCFNKNIVVLDDLNSSGNASNVTVTADDRLLDDKYLLSLITSPSSNANLIILFSKKKIMSLARQALDRLGKVSPNQVNNGYYKDYDPNWDKSNVENRILPPTYHERNMTPDQQRRYRMTQKHANIIPSQIMKDTMMKLPGVENITDPLLLQCLLAGFGYTYRVSDAETEEELENAANNMQIVTGLFSQGKIKTLLATDAVGIGVNLKVLKMFIPTIYKFEGPIKGSQPLETGNAAQLFARVGRNAFPESAIYTPAEFVPAIIQAMASNPSQFQQRLTVEPITRAMCMTISLFQALWNNIHGIN